ncbi:hypothetical protein BJ546DRAFT_1062018 [Cryomyces antarcticus]
MSWADEAEASVGGAEREAETGAGNMVSESEVQQNDASQSPRRTSDALQQTDTPSVSSPEFGTSSTSTLPKEDDISSIPNASPETTWENKSQTSEPTAKPNDHKEGSEDSEKSEETVKEKSPIKILQEAPPPAVNIWLKRAQEQKARATLAGPSKGVGEQNSPVLPKHEKSQEQIRPEAKRKSKSMSGIPEESDFPLNMGKDRKKSTDFNGKGRDQPSGSHYRQGSKIDSEGHTDLARRAPSKAAAPERSEKPNYASAPPPVRDQRSWPTPESAQDEERKRAQGKEEKAEKERNTTTTSKPHGKNEWVSVPYTPNVIFSTPLPNTRPRGDPRGDHRSKESLSRRAPRTNGAGDVSAASPTALPNGDEPSDRGRTEPKGTYETEPQSKGDRAASVGAQGGPYVSGSPSERAAREAAFTGSDSNDKRGFMQDSAILDQFPPSTNTFPRQSQASRRNKSPKKYDPAGVSGRRRESQSEPFARRPSGGAHYDEVSERALTFAHDGSLPTRSSIADRRGEGRPFVDNWRDSGNPPPFREGRGRGVRGGRGGSRGFANGHHPGGHQYSNGQSPALQTLSTLNHASSPATFQGQQGVPFGPQSQQTRNFRGPASRSQSIPIESYGRYPAGYPSGPPHMAPLQTYMGGMYEYQGVQPVSAVPYGTPYSDQYNQLNMVSMQLEYYFSVDNLCKDMFLRKHMDSQGFVFLSVIAEFRRIKQLTTDMELIKFVCLQSPDTEFRVGVDGRDRLRRKDGWEQWILAMPERDPSARNDGPSQVERPPMPHPRVFDPQYVASQSASPTGAAFPQGLQGPQGPPHDAPYQSLNGVASTFVPAHAAAVHETSNGTYPGGMVNGANGTSLARQHPYAALDSGNIEGDSFPDAQIETLTVVVKQNPNLQSSCVLIGNS